MGTWLDANPGAALTIGSFIIMVVVYVIRMEGEMKGLKARVHACESRANEDRGDVRGQLLSIGLTVDDIKVTLNQLVGALGRRSTDSRFEISQNNP